MYKCFECGSVFEEPKKYSEDLTPGGTFEGGNFIKYYTACPQCGGDYDNAIECDYCGEFAFLKYGEHKDGGFCCQGCLDDMEE